jgi:single-strand DNA-binding protein
MNTVILMGRLTRDPEIRYSAGENATGFASYRLAVDRRFKREGQPEADFFNCVVFGRQVEFVEKYFHKGIKIVIQGRVENDNYTDRDGRMVYGTRIVVENQEFAESKAASQQSAGGYRAPADPQGGYNAPADSQGGYSRPAAQLRQADPIDTSADGFMNIPDGIDEELPFA